MKTIIFLALIFLLPCGFCYGRGHGYGQTTEKWFLTGSLGGDEISEMKLNPVDWVLDDMILPLNIFDHHSGIMTSHFKWPNQTVVYTFTNLNKTSEKIVGSIMEGISNRTCITFRQKEKNDLDWIEITGKGHNRTTLPCDSTVGHRKGQMKKMTLADDICWSTGFLHHEFGHALGIFHEHQRPDRDEYVNIHWDNIPDDAKANFGLKFPPSVMETFDIPYDYISVMHYPSFFFAINPSLPTISRKDCPDCAVGGESEGFSVFDYEKINRMYNCK